MNSRRQSLDRPGILSPPGPFLTPSPSPSISAASPRLAPSPSISPFQQDVLLVANNTITNTIQEQERKAATPGRRHSINQLNNSGSPNAGTVVFQPSPSQSPAAATTVIGVTGNEFNTTLVGSNNISLNKKGKRSSQTSNFISNYGQTTATNNTAVSTSGAVTFTSSSNYMAGFTKGQAKKIGVGGNNISNFINQPQNQNQQQQQHQLLQQQITAHQLINPSSSPLLADSPISSPSNHQMKPPTPQPQILQQQQIPTVINTSGGNQILQFLQGQQIINATNTIQSMHQPQHHQQQQFQTQNVTRQISSSMQNASQGHSFIQQSSAPTTISSTKTTKAPQQILPKPNLDNNSKNITTSKQQPPMQQQQLQQSPQISQSPGPPQIATTATPQPQGGQIILPTGNLTGQPLVLNQMPVIVQQNTPQGVQLILRPPTPQLATTPSLVIHNSRPQLQQQPQQQLLRILNTNGAMQLAAAPTFIVSSQANLIQQNLQTIKATPNPQNGSQAAATAMTTALNSLQAAVGSPQQQQQRSQQLAAAINNHIFSQNMAAQLQNLQINGNLAQIQLPNGIHASAGTPMLSQIPQFQQSIATTAGFNQQIQQNINLNQINTANLQQIAAAAAAAGAAFQSPPPPNINQQTGSANASASASPQLVTEINHLPTGANLMSTANLQFSTQNSTGPQHITIKSPAVTPQPQIIQSITPEPTVVLANNGRNSSTSSAAAVLVQPDHIIQQIQQQQMLAVNNTQQRAGHSVDVIRQQPPPPKARKSNKGRKKKNDQTQIAQTPIITPSFTSSSSSIVNSTHTTNIDSNNLNAMGMSTSISSLNSSVTTSSTENSTKRESLSPPLKSTGKLDLANVMKLCGIMEDDDYMMDDEPLPPMPIQNQLSQNQQLPPQEEYNKLNQTDIESNSLTAPMQSPSIQQTQSQQQSQSTSAVNNVNETSDIMITIPSQSNNDVPFTFTIPTSQCDSSKTINTINSNVNSANMLNASPQNISNIDISTNSILAPSSNLSNVSTIPNVTSQQHQAGSTNEEQIQVPQNFVIKIDSNDVGGQPYTISIPGLTSNDIQQQLSMIQTQPPLQGLQLIPQQSQSQQVQLQLTPTTGVTTTTSMVQSIPPSQMVNSNQISTQQTQNFMSKSTAPISSSFITIPTSSVSVSNVPLFTSTSMNNNPIITSTGMTGAVTITTFANQITPVPTITSRMTEIQNSLMGVNPSSQQHHQQPTYLQHQQLSQMIPTSSIITSTTFSTISNTIPNSTLNTSTSSIAGGNILTTATATTTTAAIKPRRKPPVKRTNKKSQAVVGLNNTITSSNNTISEVIPTSVCNVPSQIGNIQISQIDATKQQGQNQLPPIATNIVENKIQIMPIIDPTKNTVSSTASLNIPQPNSSIGSSSITTTNSAITTSSTTIGNHQQQQPINNNENVSSNQLTSSTAASLITQLTGALSLAFSEDGSRLMLRHDPNTPQDSQSQIILQAVLSGALPNMTIINEPIDKSKSMQINAVGNQKVTISTGLQPILQPSQALPVSNIQGSKMNIGNQNNSIKQQLTTNMANSTMTNSINQQCIQPQPLMQSISNDSLALLQKRPSLEVKKNEVPLVNISQQAQQPAPLVQNTATPQAILPSSSVVVTPKIVALPKIEANQQLFSLNTITNQITQINPNQTTASLGPMERLLIVPAGINAQQLSQCMLQGQIHFDNVNHQTSDQNTTSQPQLQQTQVQPLQQQMNLPVGTATPRIQQQQIVHPLSNQQQSTSKQVANVAPIIDASRVSSTNVPSKGDQLKNTNSSGMTTTASKRGKPRKQKIDLLKNSNSKPIQKISLSTKPNNSNLVQIVQPTTTTQQSQQQPQQQQNLNKDQNLPRSTASGPFTSQTLSGNGTKLVGVTAPMQQVNRVNTLPSNTPVNNVVNSTPMVMNSANVINSIRTQNSNNPNLSNIMPLISVNPAQTTVTRVQTIQLTPQQQQLLKNVQMQIQQLSTKLKNPNLLSTLNIPADFDPNNPMYNKPLPTLHNINAMTDTEIHAALQRLFIEQQKILASGKVIPTIQAPNVGGFSSLISQSPQQLVQPVQQQLVQPVQQQSSITPIQNVHNSNQITNKSSLMNNENQNQSLCNFNLNNQKLVTVLPPKNDDKLGIPSNVVQPNNHNKIISNNNSSNNVNNNNNNNKITNAGAVTQRIPIYPLQQSSTINSQHQQVFNQQQQQIINSQQNLPHSSQLINFQQNQHVVVSSNSQLQHIPISQSNKIQNLQQYSQKQQPKHIQQLNNKQTFSNLHFASAVTSSESNQLHIQQHQLEQHNQHQQQQLNQQSNMPQNNQFNNQDRNQQHDSNLFVSNIKLENDEAQDFKPFISNEQQQQQNYQEKIENERLQQADEKKTPVQTLESPKPKIARHALFERQLQVDQLACVKPDYITPFQSKEEAVKRLIRYHCVYQQDEEFPSDEEHEFEKAAVKFQDKFQNLSNEYQKLILKESVLPHRTSELCLINRLLVTDIQTELLQMRSEASKAYYDFETSPDTFNISPVPIKSDPDLKCDIESAFSQEQENSKFFLSDSVKSDIKKEPYDFCNSFKLDDDCSTTNSFSQNTNSSSSASNNEISSISNKETNFNSNKISSSMFSKGGFLSDKDDNKKPTYIETSKSMKESHKNNEQSRSFSSALGNSNSYDMNISFHNKNNNTNKFCDTQTNIKKENLENFDIESEITPSFIMKKIDSKPPPLEIPFSTNSPNNIQINNKFTNINENKYSSNFDKGNISERKISILNENKFSHNKFNNLKSNQIINGPSNSKLNNSNEQRFHINEQHRSNFSHNNDFKLTANNQNRLANNDNHKFNINDLKSSSDNMNSSTIKTNNKFHSIPDDFDTDDESNTASNDFSLDFNFDQLKESRHENSEISKRNEYVNENQQNNNGEQGEQYNEWLTLQKELTLMTEKKSENQHQNLLLHQQIRSTQNMQIHHPQISINHTNNQINVAKSVEKQLSEIFDSDSPTPKDVDSQLSELFNSTNAPSDNMLPNGHNSSATTNSKLTPGSHNIQLSELINTEIININHNSIGSKAVETRLESMFGESPVVEKNDNATDIVESHLNEIFNNTATQGITATNQTNNIHQHSNNLDHFNPQRMENTNFTSNNHLLNNAKRPWTSLDHSDILGESNETERNVSNNLSNDAQGLTSKRMCINSYMEESSTNNSHQQSSRWMLENQFGDFLTTNPESNSEKNRWNGQNHISNNNILSDSQISKKSNDDIVDSWANHHHDSHYNLHEPDFPQIEGMAVNTSNHLQQHNNQDQNNLQHNFTSHDSVFNTSHSHMNHTNLDNHHNTGNISGTNSSANQSNTSITSNFDDDINRHVQNAIDSILNLQNSESDSLNFSLDHSMGSFLADSPLDQHNQQQQQQQQQQQPQQQQQQQRHQQQQQNSDIIDSSSCMQNKRNRNNRIDDLNDCLISGAVGENSNIMIHSPMAPNNTGSTVNTISENGNINSGNGNSGSSNRATNSLHNITDFSCVGTGLEEAVKSIMTS